MSNPSRKCNATQSAISTLTSSAPQVPQIARTSTDCCSFDFIDKAARGAAIRAAARRGCTKAPSRRTTAAVDVAARAAVGRIAAAAEVTNAMVEGEAGEMRGGGG